MPSNDAVCITRIVGRILSVFGIRAVQQKIFYSNQVIVTDYEIFLWYFTTFAPSNFRPLSEGLIQTSLMQRRCLTINTRRRWAKN